MKHTHYIYEVVMTDEEREQVTPIGFMNDRDPNDRDQNDRDQNDRDQNDRDQNNRDQDQFEITAIQHDHDIPEDPDSPTHTHMPDPIQAGNYLDVEVQP